MGNRGRWSRIWHPFCHIRPSYQDFVNFYQDWQKMKFLVFWHKLIIFGETCSMKPLLFLRCPFRVVCYMCYAFARGPFVRQQLASLAVDGGPLATAPHIPQTTLTGLRKSSAIIHVGSLRSLIIKKIFYLRERGVTFWYGTVSSIPADQVFSPYTHCTNHVIWLIFTCCLLALKQGKE